MLDRADADDAGVVNQHVDRTESLLDHGDHLVDPFGHRQVAWNGDDPAATAGEIMNCSLQFVRITGADCRPWPLWRRTAGP